MTDSNVTKELEKKLLSYITEEDPMLCMLHKVERLAKSMGIEQISASQVSEVSKELDVMVEESWNGPLQAEHPMLWIDALYEKIREDCHVENMAVLVVGIFPNKASYIQLITSFEYEEEWQSGRAFINVQSLTEQKVTIGKGCMIDMDPHDLINLKLRTCLDTGVFGNTRLIPRASPNMGKALT